MTVSTISLICLWPHFLFSHRTDLQTTKTTTGTKLTREVQWNALIAKEKAINHLTALSPRSQWNASTAVARATSQTSVRHHQRSESVSTVARKVTSLRSVRSHQSPAQTVARRATSIRTARSQRSRLFATIATKKGMEGVIAQSHQSRRLASTANKRATPRQTVQIHHQDRAQIVKKKVIGWKTALSLRDHQCVSTATRRATRPWNALSQRERSSAQTVMVKVTGFTTAHCQLTSTTSLSRTSVTRSRAMKATRSKSNLARLFLRTSSFDSDSRTKCRKWSETKSTIDHKIEF